VAPKDPLVPVSGLVIMFVFFYVAEATFGHIYKAIRRPFNLLPISIHQVEQFTLSGERIDAGEASGRQVFIKEQIRVNCTMPRDLIQLSIQIFGHSTRLTVYDLADEELSELVSPLLTQCANLDKLDLQGELLATSFSDNACSFRCNRSILSRLKRLRLISRDKPFDSGFFPSLA
jgi:hypothetical protein